MVEEERVASQVESGVANESPKTLTADEIRQQVEAEWGTKFNSELDKRTAAIRRDFEKKLAESKMTAEEKAKLDREQEFTLLQEQVKSYKATNSRNLREKSLTEAGLPVDIFGEHSKLLSVEDDDIPLVVKELKAIWEGTKAKVLQNGVQSTEPAKGKGQTVSPQMGEKLAEKYPWLKDI